MLRTLCLMSGLFTLAVSGCAFSTDEGDDEDDVAETSTTTTPSLPQGIDSPAQGSAASSNVLALAYPDSLAVAAFPKSGLALTVDSEDKPISEKIEENKGVLAGTAASCLDPLILNGGLPPPPSITCYEFDSDMNPSEFADSQQTLGTVDGTHSDGEACMVAFARSQVVESVDTIDQALSLVAGLICQAKKDDANAALPAAGAENDYTAALTTAVAGHMSVESATIKRLSDAAGLPVFRTDLSLSDADGRTIEVHLIHSPGSDDSTYKGTLFSKRTGFHQAAGEHDPNNVDAKNDVMSIKYQKVTEDGEPRVRFEVRRAQIVNTAEPFDDKGLVDYNAVPQDAGNDQIHAINYLAFDMNPETNEGTMSYWMNPGGNYHEAARGFLFNIENTDDTLKGCGVSGSTSSISVRKATAEPSEANVLKPTRYWHPRGGQNIHANKDPRYEAGEGPFITKQCFTQETSGLYVIDTAVTTHERGYDVIAQAQNDVLPPEKPSEELAAIE